MEYNRITNTPLENLLAMFRARKGKIGGDDTSGLYKPANSEFLASEEVK
jgi:hypothetical protein